MPSNMSKITPQMLTNVPQIPDSSNIDVIISFQRLQFNIATKIAYTADLQNQLAH